MPTFLMILGSTLNSLRARYEGTIAALHREVELQRELYQKYVTHLGEAARGPATSDRAREAAIRECADVADDVMSDAQVCDPKRDPYHEGRLDASTWIRNRILLALTPASPSPEQEKAP